MTILLEKSNAFTSVVDPDPGGQKWPRKKQKTEISYFEELDVLF